MKNLQDFARFIIIFLLLLRVVGALTAENRFGIAKAVEEE